MHRRLRLTPRAACGLASCLPLVLLPLGACTPDYPMDKPGTWSLPPGTLGSNDANLRVMVVDPHDLTAGASADGSEGTAAAPPVQRLVSGRRPPLLDTNGTPLGSTEQRTSATSPGAAGTNGSCSVAP